MTEQLVTGNANGDDAENRVRPDAADTPFQHHRDHYSSLQTSLDPKSTKMPVIDITKDLSALISQQMRATPNAAALEDETKTLTYAELDHKVGILAHRLRDQGVSRDCLVGVLLGRSADYVIACLAALRAGGAFLVLELAYPPALLTDVIEDAKPVVVVTSTVLAGRVKAGIPLIILDKPEMRNVVNGLTISNGIAKEHSQLPADNDLERLAFVSYSSGTTGRPKGIANPHRAPVRSYDLRFRLSDLRPGDRVACNVFFVWEILRPLLRGATVVAVPDEVSYDPVALVDLLSSKHITETLMTPTLLTAILARHPQIQNRLPDLHTLWFNGEVVTTDLAQRAIKALPKTRLLNCYSASETHEIACGDIRDNLDPKASYCPVGLPMDPEHTYILGEDGQKVKPGVSGELFVGGSLLARGYLNRPETTAKAFKLDPFNSTPGARMYATGDVARMLPSGVLEITGRVGAMLKVRGYSIVPGKVEKAIFEHLAVRHCAVIAHGDGLDRQLVAYVVLDKEDQQNRTILTLQEGGFSPAARRALSASLPQYMIPALWVQLDELPTHSVSGKADLKRLPPPVITPAITRSNSPDNFNDGKSKRNTEISIESITELWAESLNTSPTSITQDSTFFDLGGHSLTLADLATRLSRNYEVPIPLAQLVVNPTLEGHLEVVRAARWGVSTTRQTDLAAALRADTVLPPEIKPSGASICALSEATTVLLTGVTGFLGAFLLNDLLESTSARIVCLVRFRHPEKDDLPAAIARIRRNLLELGLWKDSILDRIDILPGNLAADHLGLSPDTFKELASRVQVIVHAGATVNLVYPYAALRDANVCGTKEILRLACQAGATLQYISTNGVLPPSDQSYSEDAMLDIKDVPEKLVDGYGQTKWVAEQLVLEAGRRGLPVRILRPGTISGHSTSGSTNTYDLLTALIVESLHIGFAPDIEGWRAEMTPVDFVSKAIITLSNQTDLDQRVFHLGDPNPINTSTLFDDLNELGYITEHLAWDDWVALWTEKRGSAKGGDGIFTIDILRGGMPTVDFLKHNIILNDEATKPALGKLPRPVIDSQLLENYARHWYALGWLSKPPLKSKSSARLAKKGSLSGKVAVITGASSGIGAAVAVALAREGAHIALAARRTDALENVKRKASQYGVKVLIHPTDVTKRTDVESLICTTNDQLGPVDILVSCAGVMYFTMMHNLHVEEWERTVDVNCKGLLHCLSSVLPSMLSRGTGHILAISSDAGRKVFPGLGVYSASKFFVEATLQSLRLETAGTGLRVTSIQPGNTATELLGMSTDQEAIKKYGESTGARVLDPEDVAGSIIYALKQPEYVAVNEVLIEPREEPI